MGANGWRAVTAVSVLLLAAAFSGCSGEGNEPLAPLSLTDDPGDETTPDFSPDGKWIAYTWSTSENESHVWVIRLSGKEKRRITSAWAMNGSPAWSHDGKWIAFQSSRDGKSNIYVAQARTEEGDNAPPARALTRDSGMNGAPSWSPDDRFIAFESDRNGRFGIWVMNADGDNQHALTRSTSHDNRPAWSPDGKLIAFSSERSGNSDIWIVNPDGSFPRRLTADVAQEWRPRWTPDSGQLVYMCAETPERVEFRQVFRDGRGAKQLVASTASIRDPVVSPDGKWLAFSSNRKGTYDLYLLRLDN
jgi:TolB protein